MRNKLNIQLLTVAFSFASVLFFACNKDAQSTKDTSANTFQPNFTMAKTSNELNALRNDPSANIIRSQADFDAIVATKNSALMKLSIEQIANFRASIVVRSGIGVVGLKYGPIQKALSYDDFSEVLGMFGLDAKQGFWGFSQDEKIIQILTDNASESQDARLRPATAAVAFEDHKGYYCSVVYAHTCGTNADSICLSGC